LLPPALKKGKGNPVMGINRKVIPMLMVMWAAKKQKMPTTRKA
jgi:hypothetical protein